MNRPKLAAQDRKTVGKQVRKLRKEGILPANVYGKKTSSFAIQVNQKEFEKLFAEVGQTGLVDLSLGNKTHPVLVKNIQFSYPFKTAIHIDFYEVDLTQKVKAMVPLELTGEAKAVTDNIGILLTQISEVEVEALPEKLPEHITVDLSNLSAVDEQITVADLKAPEGVNILTDKEQVVVKVAELVTKEAQAEAEAQAAAAEAAKAEGAAEGAPAPEGEGEKPAEAKPEPEKQEEKKE